MTPWLAVLPVAALTVHTIVNRALLRRPGRPPSTVPARVAVLLPVRDEAHRVQPTLESLLAQQGVPDLQIVVLDDGSSDGTGELAAAIAAGDPRFRLVQGQELPPGWLGKPYACQQLADQVPGADVLVFVDADVVLTPPAIASTVELLAGVDLVSPYPRIMAATAGERLVQPLLVWSWLTFLPVRAVERSRRPSLSAAGGQLLAVTRAGYDRAGGHAAVRDRILEDIELARAVKRSGGRVRLADGSRLAACRMYESWTELVNGYRKSLWASFGSPVGAAAVGAALLLLYCGPVAWAAVAVAGGWWSSAAAAGVAYGLGVAGRIVGRTSGTRWWPDAFAHPVSVALFATLLVRSFRGRRRHTLAWKGRVLP